ncbi:MAG: class I SAM-dependent methyltransferase [Oceanococcus sp.]
MKTHLATESWLQSARGQALCSAEREQVKSSCDALFGRSLLQIGCWSKDLLQVEAQWRSGVLGPHGKVDVRCDLSQLPLASRSVDAVLLAHSLESAPSAHQLLRETDRILSPRGQLLILGFNPWSVWGMRQRFLKRYPALPDGVRPLGHGRVQDWLRLLDYEVLEHGRISPLHSERNWPPLSWPWMKLILNWFAPVYLIRARKRRMPMSPVQRPIWGKAAAGMDTVGMPTRSGAARVVVPIRESETST